MVRSSEPMHGPTLVTSRLLLRPFRLADAKMVERLAGDPEVALTTKTIPFPYPPGGGRSWILKEKERWDQGECLSLAIVEGESGQLLGTMTLDLDPATQEGEFAYWVGRPFWNRGIATEAGLAMCEYGFSNLGLVGVWGRHWRSNPASGKVMRKLGFQYRQWEWVWVRGQWLATDVYFRSLQGTGS